MNHHKEIIICTKTWGIEISADNNGNIYLYTSAETESTDFAFNSFTLEPTNGNSQILYAMDINFSVLNAINFGTVKQWLIKL